MSRVRLPFIAAALVTVAAVGLACSDRTLIAVGPRVDGSNAMDGSACTPSGDATIPPVSSGAANLRKGLVGLWHFDEGPCATTAIDSSGYGNDGTLMGQLDPSTVWVKGGRIGNALAVEGLGYVRVPLSESISSITSAVTISAWVYLEGTIATGNNYGTALSRQIGTSIDQYYHLSLWNAEAKPHLFISTAPEGSVVVQTGGVQPVSAAGAPLKVWTHLAGTYDGAMAILYVNGDPIDSVPRAGTFPLDTNPLIIGGNGNGASQAVSELFPGRIDEVALYNRALDAAEIQQLWNAVSF